MLSESLRRPSGAAKLCDRSCLELGPHCETPPSKIVVMSEGREPDSRSEAMTVCLGAEPFG
jgi:hypothetical protein